MGRILIGITLILLALAPSQAHGGPGGEEALEEGAAKEVLSRLRRETRVVQRRSVDPTWGHEITAMVGIVPNDAFRLYLPLGLRYGLHLPWRLSLELSGAYLVSLSTGLDEFIAQSIGEGMPGSRVMITLEDRQVAHFEASLAWALLHGKVALAERAVVHFDVYLLAGGGAVITEVASGQGDATVMEIRPSGLAGLGVRLYPGAGLAVRLEARQVLFPKLEGGLSTPTEISLGLSVLLGGQGGLL